MAYFPLDYPVGSLIVVWFNGGQQRAVWQRMEDGAAHCILDANDVVGPDMDRYEWDDGFSIETRFDFIDAERSARVTAMVAHGVPIEKWLAVLGLTTVSKG